MNTISLEIIDIAIPLLATVFIGFISLKTLDYKQQESLQLKSKGFKVPWYRRHMLDLTRQELRIHLAGRCVAFFLLIMTIQLVKVFNPGFTTHVLASIVIAAVLLITIPVSYTHLTLPTTPYV